MPHTASAKKRLRKSHRRRLRNRATIRDIKGQLRSVQASASGNDLAQLTTQARLAIKKLDKAAQRRVIHPNMAARKKSQLMRLLHSKSAPAAGTPQG